MRSAAPRASRTWGPDRRSRTDRPAPDRPCARASRRSISVVEDDGEQRTVDLDAGVEIACVVDESQALEFLHEEVHTRPGGAHDFRKCFLRDLGDHLTRLDLLAVARQQEQRASQSLLARIEE